MATVRLLNPSCSIIEQFYDRTLNGVTVNRFMVNLFTANGVTMARFNSADKLKMWFIRLMRS